MKNEICTCGHSADNHCGYGVLNCLTVGCHCQEYEELDGDAAEYMRIQSDYREYQRLTGDAQSHAPDLF
jgi:hypothetical protein